MTPMIVPMLGLAANMLLALGSYAMAAAALRQPRGWPRWLAAAVIFWTAATIGLEGLGTAGAIGVIPILAWSLLFATIGGLAWWLRGAGPTEEPAREEPPAGWDATISLGLVLAVSLIYLIPSLLSAVKVVSDGPIYHLYFAARWWKAGRLILVAAPFGENASTYFPANGDLWFTWLLASWGGDALAKVGQAPFLPIAAMAAHSGARQLGCGRSAAIISACGFAACTPFLLFSFEPNVDTIFVAGYLLASYFFLRFAAADGGLPALALGALSAGLALGTKPTAVVFVPPLLVLVSSWILIGPGTWRQKTLRLGIVTSLPMATGGYWFLRDAWLTGNPLYPLDVRLMGRTLLSGWYGPDAMRTSPYYLPRGHLGSLRDIAMAVMDPRMAPLWLAGVLGAWNSPRMRSSRPWIALFAFWALANVALYWIVIPYRTQQRFMLHAIGLAVVPTAALLDRSHRLRAAAVLMLALHVATPQSWPFPAREDAIPWDADPRIPNAVGSLLSVFPPIEPGYDPTRAGGPAAAFRPLLLGLIASAIVMVRAWQRATTAQRRALAGIATLAFLGLGFAEAGPRAFEPMFRFYPPFRDFYAGWRAFDSHCGPRGVRVAYAGTNIPYYLLGPGLRNEVRYINVDAHRDWLLHDYHRDAMARGEGLWPNSRPGWDRIRPDDHAWLDNLDAEGIQLLVVTRVNPAEGPHNVADAEGFPIERRWADSHPERFQPLYGQSQRDPWFRLYRVIPPRTRR